MVSYSSRGSVDQSVKCNVVGCIAFVLAYTHATSSIPMDSKQWRGLPWYNELHGWKDTNHACCEVASPKIRVSG
jgi:hypothetical protein